jgi:L-asparaginase
MSRQAARKKPVKRGVAGTARAPANRAAKPRNGATDGLGARIPGPGGEQYPTSPLGEQVRGIPTGRDVDWQPLVDYRRFGVSETTIHGAVAWASGGKIIHSFGGNVLCYGRSMMKPLAMKVFAKELENCTWGQKSIAVSSHNGDTEHVAAAQSLLHETEWGLMQAPLELPLVQFGRTVRRPRRWYHTCSGEHAAILKGCKAKGWPRIGYLLPQHPWFQAYQEEARKVLGKNWKPLRIARDGCGLPTLSNTVSELAVLYAHLARTRKSDWIWEAFTRNPDLVGGFNRLDTTILKSCEGRVIAKEGADGLLGLAIDRFPRGPRHRRQDCPRLESASGLVHCPRLFGCPWLPLAQPLPTQQAEGLHCSWRRSETIPREVGIHSDLG